MQRKGGRRWVRGGRKHLKERLVFKYAVVMGVYRD